jgi:hypothetical protein
MTKLEEEIKKAIVSNPKQAGRTDVPADFPTRAAIAAAEVAKKYIRGAYIEGYYALANMDNDERPYEEPSGIVLAEKWLKENGITSDNSVETIDPPY